jgi:hypothetical protein
MEYLIVSICGVFLLMLALYFYVIGSYRTETKVEDMND